MKFGKRGDSDDAGTPGETAGESSEPPPVPAPAPVPPQPLPPVPESPPPVAEHEVPVAEQEVPGSPAGEELPVVQAEPVVEGEAYEVFADESSDTLTVHQHEPAQQASAMPDPVAEQPVSVVSSGPGPAPVATLGDSGEAFASGHAAAPGPSWQEPVMELADERPELVVAAAFAGGLLAAMILRRLGS
ncbi:MAG TPA: hypothetical protein VGR11_06770 [Solirubrobacteraceae bacterium]|nr:hypothetical protein [Solirubrobacteraceae bacterium]